MSPSEDFWDVSRWTPSTSSHSPRPSSSASVPSSAGALHPTGRLAGRAGNKGNVSSHRRRAPLSSVQRSQGRWEHEVARSVGSSEGHAEHSRNRGKARMDMQCAGDKVAAFFETTGSNVKAADADEAAERAQQRIREKKEMARADEEQRLEEGTKRAAARQTKTNQVRKSHENRIRLDLEAAKKAARASQEQEEAETLRDILTLRVARAERQRKDEDQRRAAELTALTERIQIPLSHLSFENRLSSPRPTVGQKDDDALRSLLVGSPTGPSGLSSKGGVGTDDMLLDSLLAPTNDVRVIHQLMGMPHDGSIIGPSPHAKDADAVKRFMVGDDDASLYKLLGGQSATQPGSRELHDTNAIRLLVGKEPLQASRDSIAIQQLMGQVNASQESQDASALQRMMGQSLPRQTMQDDDALQQILGHGNSPQGNSHDAAALQALMGQSPSGSHGMTQDDMQVSIDAHHIQQLMGQAGMAPSRQETMDTQNLQRFLGGATNNVAAGYMQSVHHPSVAHTQESRDVQNLERFLGGPQQLAQPVTYGQESRDAQNLERFLAGPQQLAQPVAYGQESRDVQSLQRFLGSPAHHGNSAQAVPLAYPHDARDAYNLGGSRGGYAQSAQQSTMSYAQEARDAQSLDRFLGQASSGAPVASMHNLPLQPLHGGGYSGRDDNVILNLMR